MRKFGQDLKISFENNTLENLSTGEMVKLNNSQKQADPATDPLPGSVLMRNSMLYLLLNKPEKFYAEKYLSHLYRIANQLKKIELSSLEEPGDFDAQRQSLLNKLQNGKNLPNRTDELKRDCDNTIKSLQNAGKKNENQWSALLLAVVNNCDLIVEWLFEMGVHPDEGFEDTETTALMMASERGNFNIVKLCVKHGADIDLQNGDDDTALDISTNKKITQFLQKERSHQSCKLF